MKKYTSKKNNNFQTVTEIRILQYMSSKIKVKEQI